MLNTGEKHIYVPFTVLYELSFAHNPKKTRKKVKKVEKSEKIDYLGDYLTENREKIFDRQNWHFFIQSGDPGVCACHQNPPNTPLWDHTR